MLVERLLIGGEWLESQTGQTIDVVDPARGEQIATIARGDHRDVDRAVNSSIEAGRRGSWRTLRPSERGRILTAVAQAIRQFSDELVHLEMIDTGKPTSQARGEIESAANFFDYSASTIDKITGSTIPVGPGAFNFTVREPWGVSAQITPWNYPLHLATRGIAPALAMGNTVVLKPAEEASLSCLRFGQLALDAGLPPGVLNIVTGYGVEAGAALAAHPGINHLTFTGSVEIGTAVMKLAATNIVPVSLELGGKSPQIVFPDADLNRAIPAIVRSFVANAGQTCSAGTRLLVHASAQSRVVNALAEAVRTVRIGLPQEDPDLGPLISAKQRERVQEYVELGQAEGMSLRAGGTRPADHRLKGFYFLPTLFDNTPPTSRLFNEEIFGPVLCVTPFTGVDEAIYLANATPYGLSAAIWTESVSKAFQLAAEIQAGQVYINSFGIKENIGVPFGGYKKSGFGREKGLEAHLGYTQLKNIAVEYS
ncbi:MAG: aldehyde dehydrogenase family protein [Truepera sp.]|jgi:acyl-CoA reductase-like NAD-dependent aldehyde dehydrogenase|nr:aldehyde dehydrogenase family protein [Truepera sp.]